MTQFECDQLMSSLQTEVDYSSFKDMDIVIEAVFEDMNLKHRIIKEVSFVHFASFVFGLSFRFCFIYTRGDPEKASQYENPM